MLKNGNGWLEQGLWEAAIRSLGFGDWDWGGGRCFSWLLRASVLVKVDRLVSDVFGDLFERRQWSLFEEGMQEMRWELYRVHRAQERRGGFGFMSTWPSMEASTTQLISLPDGPRIEASAPFRLCACMYMCVCACVWFGSPPAVDPVAGLLSHTHTHTRTHTPAHTLTHSTYMYTHTYTVGLVCWQTRGVLNQRPWWTIAAASPLPPVYEYEHSLRDA